MWRAGAAVTEATPVAAARAAMVVTMGRSATDATVTKTATVATTAMAAMEIPLAVGAVGSHSGDRQCIKAVAVVLIVGRHSASHDGILQHEWWPATGGCNKALLRL